jgi:hypothetical protein
MFAGDRLAAHRFAKEQAAEFDALDYAAETGHPYFSGRDVMKRERHHFVVKPAIASAEGVTFDS